jgi:hypothetical protein
MAAKRRKGAKARWVRQRSGEVVVALGLLAGRLAKLLAERGRQIAKQLAVGLGLVALGRSPVSA